MAFFRSGAIRVGFVVIATTTAVCALAIYVFLIRDLPDFRSLDDYRPPVVSEVFDRNGKLIGEFYTQQRRIVKINEIPPHVKHAFVAAEDGSFYTHQGVDYSSILRAAMANFRRGEITQGASTITQQMVKSLLLSPERTYRRKLREIILSRQIEQQFTKNEILFLYLNQIYFGNSAWGIGQAARSYFGKEAPDLTISEAALLAGLPQRPSAYDPNRNPRAAESRRRYVLVRMLGDGYINRKTYETELASPPQIRRHPDEENLRMARYFTEEVRRRLFEHLESDAILNQGLRIDTTLDIDLQRAAFEAVQSGLQAHDRRRGYRGPVRQILEDEIASELIRLKKTNQGKFILSPATSLDGDVAGESTPVLHLEIPFDEPIHGLVLAVDADKQIAQIGFGSGVSAIADLDDVDWAREPDVEVRPHPVKNISSIFSVGDVAQFVRIQDRSNEKTGREPFEQRRARVDLWQVPEAEGALLSMDNDTGDVLAMIGGYDFTHSEFNRAVQAKRQPGSAFKPFIYGAALTRGYTPVSTVIDRPVVYTDPVTGFIWAPRNYGRKFYGPMTMRDALKKSVNNATVHLFRDLGVRYVIDYARRLGIQAPLTADLSLALGSSSLTLLELTRAYAIYPRGGTRINPGFITRVTDGDGNELLGEMVLGEIPPPVRPAEPIGDKKPLGSEETFENLAMTQIITPADAYLMSDLLRTVVQEGTGRRLRRLGRTLAGKTGTTNDFSDAWFMGFSPELTTGVWVGHDDNGTLGWGESGGKTALPIWGAFMKVALAPYSRRDFEVPDEIEFQRIDRTSGLLADANSKNAYFQAFLEGTAPERSFTEQDTTKKRAQAARDELF
jgi:penicillin-binding protein 1A